MTQRETPYLTQAKKPAFYYGYIIVAAAFLILAMGAMSLGIYGVFFKPLAAEFGWTRSITSGAYSFSMFITGFLGIFTGTLTDRFGPKIVVTIFGLFLGVGILLMSQISSTWQLYIAFGVIAGIGRSACFAPVRL